MHHFKHRKETEDRNPVEQIEYLWLYWHLWTLERFRDASRYLVFILKRIISEAAPPVVQHFQEVVADNVDYQQVLIAEALALLAAINQRITVFPRGFCYKVMEMLFMGHLFVIFGLSFLVFLREL